MGNDIFFKITAIVSPFAAAGLTYLLSLRAKKNEYLYQNRLPAFKEIAAVLIKIRKYCEGRIAVERGSEFHPYYEEIGSGLELRKELADIKQLNELFLTDKSKILLGDVDGQLNMLCHAELIFYGSSTREEGWQYIGNAYTALLDVTENCLTTMYREINLPNK